MTGTLLSLGRAQHFYRDEEGLVWAFSHDGCVAVLQPDDYDALRPARALPADELTFLSDSLQARCRKVLRDALRDSKPLFQDRTRGRQMCPATGGTVHPVMVFLKLLVSNKDRQTTFIGVLAAAVLAVPGLDLSKLFAGDWVQLAHLTAALLVAAIGWYAIKAKSDGKTTFLGTLAGGLYACSGTVEAVVTGGMVALAGYLTNKAPAEVPMVASKPSARPRPPADEEPLL